MSAIARETRIPRTTVHFLLGKLQKRKLVRECKVRGHYEWELDTTSSSILNALNSDVVTIQHGLRNFEKLYESFAHLSEGEPLFALQGNQSARTVLKHMQKSNDFLLKIHKSVKRRKVIVKGIMGENTLDLFKKLDTKSLKSHWGRATIVHIIPDKYALFNADVYSIKNKLYLFNHTDELVIIISDKITASAVHALLTFMLDHSERINLNDHIQNILNSRND